MAGVSVVSLARQGVAHARVFVTAGHAVTFLASVTTLSRSTRENSTGDGQWGRLRTIASTEIRGVRRETRVRAHGCRLGMCIGEGYSGSKAKAREGNE